MKIFVKVSTGRREDRVEKVDATHFIASVRAQAESGKANDALIELLAEHFGVPKSDVKIISGFTSRNKLISISN